MLDGTAAAGDLDPVHEGAQATSTGRVRAPAGTDPDPPTGPDRLALGDWLTPGRVVELSGGGAGGGLAPARTTTAVSLVIHAQQRGEPVVWIEPRGRGGLYPPDLAEAGVDLNRLVVVRPPAPRRPRHRTGPRGARPVDDRFRAAELLLRSGAFGLVVVDLLGAADAGPGASSRGAAGAGPRPGRAVDVWLGRLAGLARRHGSQVLLLTGADAGTGSLGALVAARIAPERAAVGPGLHRVDHPVLKDKARRGVTHGPPRGALRRAPWGAVGPRAGMPASGGADDGATGPDPGSMTDGDDHHRRPRDAAPRTAERTARR